MLGILLGPITRIIDTEFFQESSPIISTLSIILITFEAGININYETLKNIISKTLTLTLLTFTAITLGTGLIAPIIIPTLSIIEALVLGTILAGLSTIVVMGIKDQVKIESDDIWQVLALESTVVDPFRVILAIAFIQVAILGTSQPFSSFEDIIYILIMGTFIGLVTGVLWSFIIHRLTRIPNLYMVTLAILFQVYFLAELVSGNGGGTVACFIFGLVLANPKQLKKLFAYIPRIDKGRITGVNKEMSFVLKSYYFVYTGLIISVNREYMLLGVIFTLMIISIRFFTGTLVANFFKLNELDKDIIRLTYPLGTSALVFSQLPSLYDPSHQTFRNPLLFTNLVFQVVLGTIIFSSLIAPIIIKKRNHEN